MIPYIIAIWGTDFIILALNLIFCRAVLPVRGILAVTLLQPVLLILIDGMAAAFVRYLLPKRLFDHTVRFHVASKTECRLYERLGIKRWKDYVVELGMFTAFSKKSVARPGSAEYLERFILECNYGVWGHAAGIVCGFVLLVCFPCAYMLTIVLPACCVNAVLSLLPLMILRYNVPRLIRMLTLLYKKQKKCADLGKN